MKLKIHSGITDYGYLLRFPAQGTLYVLPIHAKVVLLHFYASVKRSIKKS